MHMCIYIDVYIYIYVYIYLNTFFVYILVGHYKFRSGLLHHLKFHTSAIQPDLLHVDVAHTHARTQTHAHTHTHISTSVHE